ncbi:MAG: substrate-binding domain-containing protein, partial [Lachnospiraceae bacterium]|nr:substrate-binding domain-containing protein [Lachnospiraceae bacterium]
LEKIYVDGVIFLPTSEKNEHIKKFVGKLPIIIINRNFPIGLTCVLGDDYNGGYEIGKYLIAQGHRKLGCIIDGRKRNYNIERYDGFCRAMRENELEINEDYMIRGVKDNEDLYAKLRTVLSKDNRPTALFAFDDTLAYGAYKIAKELKLSIPRELSLVGYDNISSDEYMLPPLTSYEHPYKEINETALNLLLEEIKEMNGSKQMICKMTGKMEIRESVKHI